MTQPTVDVSIVIVNWNTRELLLQCLESIVRETRTASYNVWVVDNASQDGSAAAVELRYPQVTLIKNETNRGFAAANNQALKLARARYCLLLNPDTVVLERAIDQAIVYADRHPECAVVGCQVLEDERTIQRTCFAFPTATGILAEVTGLSGLFARSPLIGAGGFGRWDRRSEREVDVVSGMFMLVRREAIDGVGLMDEDYFVYAEEADWCFRFWASGWKCIFTPEARIIHRDGGGKSTAQTSVKMFVQMQKSLLLFQRKHMGAASWLVVKTTFLVSALARASLWRVKAILDGRDSSTHKTSQAVAALRFHLFGRFPL